jgi:hypothetical protein
LRWVPLPPFAPFPLPPFAPFPHPRFDPNFLPPEKNAFPWYRELRSWLTERRSFVAPCFLGCVAVLATQLSETVMKFCFALTNLSVSDVVKIERLDITTEYTVDEFAAMMNAYPAIIDAVAKMATDAPASRPVVVN